MSAGRRWIKEFYVGFLLLALTFLYLSHLNREALDASFADDTASAVVFEGEPASSDIEFVAT